MISIITYLYGTLILLLGAYSYALIDPNITLINSSQWTLFRNTMVQLGYYQRELSWTLFLALIIALYGVHFLLISKKYYKHISPMLIAGITAAILIFSYPFLSHDLFNYIFDAKILTFYGKNPYLFRALDFPLDPWIRFMHWTHRTYPYGPTFLLITLVPSFLAFGKFLLNFLFFKMLFCGGYLASVWFLQKKNRQSAMLFATHPLIIVEGLINSHNDILAVCFAIMGSYYVLKNTKKNIVAGKALLLFSGGIKYLTLPLVLISKKTLESAIGLLLMTAGIVYLGINGDIQQWYFLNFFAILLVFPDIIKKWNVFFFLILLSYYPYIRLGGWEKPEYVMMKKAIILGSFLAVGAFLLAQSFIAKRAHQKA